MKKIFIAALLLSSQAIAQSYGPISSGPMEMPAAMPPHMQAPIQNQHQNQYQQRATPQMNGSALGNPHQQGYQGAYGQQKQYGQPQTQQPMPYGQGNKYGQQPGAHGQFGGAPLSEMRKALPTMPGQAAPTGQMYGRQQPYAGQMQPQPEQPISVE